MSVNRNQYWLGALSLVAVLLTTILIPATTNAVAFININNKPAKISSDLTPTFAFSANVMSFGTAPTECRVDGGPLDQDGVANGSIVDPVGLGKAVFVAPNTGLHK